MDAHTLRARAAAPLGEAHAIEELGLAILAPHLDLHLRRLDGEVCRVQQILRRGVVCGRVVLEGRPPVCACARTRREYMHVCMHTHDTRTRTVRTVCVRVAWSFFCLCGKSAHHSLRALSMASLRISAAMCSADSPMRSSRAISAPVHVCVCECVCVNIHMCNQSGRLVARVVCVPGYLHKCIHWHTSDTHAHTDTQTYARTDRG